MNNEPVRRYAKCWNMPSISPATNTRVPFTSSGTGKNVREFCNKNDEFSRSAKSKFRKLFNLLLKWLGHVTAA